MNKIELCTLIEAPITLCFDLARSIDLHTISVEHTNEKAIGGVTTGLIGHNQKVLWQATHFGFQQTLETKITKYNRPVFFADEMEKGIFKSMSHDHFFSAKNGTTEMIDHFSFKSPLGLLGKMADVLFLKKYLTNLLIKRNKTIKEYAETKKWQRVIPLTVK